ncbi:MAG: L,D-transpeptidase family protein, partial [bacterium]|nr:L,D-transpeptidase family protein [bacterium]
MIMRSLGYILSTVVAFFVGVGLSFTLMQGVASVRSLETAELAAPAPKPKSEVSDGTYKPPLVGKALFVDLDAMTVLAYEDGTLVKELKILSKGLPGSAWQSLPGDYHILKKEEKHYSPLGKVSMSYSIQLYGNVFMHGVPHYDDGRAVPESFSRGSIRLATADARLLFSWSDEKTPVRLAAAALPPYEAASISYVSSSSAKPRLGAASYLVADIESGEIILEKVLERSGLQTGVEYEMQASFTAEDGK